MKIIDFERKGNVVRFYLGKDDCNDYCGDDWCGKFNQGGKVYDQYIASYFDKVYPFEYNVFDPFSSFTTKDFCKDDLKNGVTPCLVITKQEGFTDFIEVLGLRDSEKIYFNDIVKFMD